MGTTWYDTIATLGWLAGITARARLLSHVYLALRHPLRAARSSRRSIGSRAAAWSSGSAPVTSSRSSRF